MRVVGLRMTRAVGQCLLNNAIDARSLQIADRINGAVDVNSYRDAGVLRKLARLPTQGRCKAGVVEHGGTQTHRNTANSIQRIVHQAPGFLEVLCKFVWRSGPQSVDISKLHSQGCEGLAHLVVELSG